jgi:hypothetical protein
MSDDEAGGIAKRPGVTKRPDHMGWHEKCAGYEIQYGQIADEHVRSGLKLPGCCNCDQYKDIADQSKYKENRLHCNFNENANI